MNTAPQFDSDTIRELEQLMTHVDKKSDFQRVQCVLLRAKFKMKAADVAEITNFKPSTVRKIWSTYARDGQKSLFCKTRGGRHNAHLSREEEKLFLEPFFQKAEEHGMLDVIDIHQSYQSLIGKIVPKSTIYRLLSRHGWKRKAGKQRKTGEENGTRPDMHDYWIDGCSQMIHPERTGNISQQWLNNTLHSMIASKIKP